MKYPKRGASLQALSAVLKRPYKQLQKEAEQFYADKLWDDTFTECITHEPSVCEGVLLGTAYRCPPCEKLHKEWRDQPRGGSSTLKLTV